MAEFPQFDLESARVLAAFVVIENGDRFCFPDRLDRPHGLSRLPVPPGIIAAGDRAQDLAKMLDGAKNALLVNEVQRTHGVGGCEKMVMAFFKISSSRASRLLTVRSARTSAALARSAGKDGWAAFYQA